MGIRGQGKASRLQYLTEHYNKNNNNKRKSKSLITWILDTIYFSFRNLWNITLHQFQQHVFQICYSSQINLTDLVSGLPSWLITLRLHLCFVVNELINQLDSITLLKYSFTKSQDLVIPSAYCFLGLFLCRCKTLHFPLLNFLRFLSAHFSSLSRCLCMTVNLSCVSFTPPSFVWSVNMLQVQSILLSRPLKEMLSSISPRIISWNTLLMTDWPPTGLNATEQKSLSLIMQTDCLGLIGFSYRQGL